MQQCMHDAVMFNVPVRFCFNFFFSCPFSLFTRCLLAYEDMPIVAAPLIRIAILIVIMMGEGGTSHHLKSLNKVGREGLLLAA